MDKTLSFPFKNKHHKYYVLIILLSLLEMLIIVHHFLGPIFVICKHLSMLNICF